MGEPTCEKISKDLFDGKLVVRPKAREDLEIRQIGHKVALTADEWPLGLDDLARKYPCPSLGIKDGCDPEACECPSVPTSSES